MKWLCSLTLAALFGAVSSASAATLVDFSGTSTGSMSTGTALINYSGGPSFTGTITNTSPFQASLTGLGFDLGAGNLSGFSGTSTNSNFVFTDGDLGNVNQFNSVTLDFGYITGSNFNGGNPPSGLLPGQSLMFTVSGPLALFSEAEIAAGLYARFQQVGPNGNLSDVATPNGGGGGANVVPEPGTMVLLGTGLLVAARARRRRQNAAA